MPAKKAPVWGEKPCLNSTVSKLASPAESESVPPPAPVPVVPVVGLVVSMDGDGSADGIAVGGYRGAGVEMDIGAGDGGSDGTGVGDAVGSGSVASVKTMAAPPPPVTERARFQKSKY